MRILLVLLLFRPARRLAEKVRAWRRHRKLVRQLRDLGVYGGTITADRSKSDRPAPPVPAPCREPDGPVPFGCKTAWLALRCGSPEPVISALRPGLRQSANWTTGLAAAQAQSGGWVFVSPVLDGFVLAVGDGLFALAERQEELNALAAQFSEVQYFASHRVSSSYCWARYKAGRCLRAYCTEDGRVLRNTGALTPEEQALGFGAFPAQDGQDAARQPGEEDVLDIAAAWGVDPRFETPYPPSTGWLCRPNGWKEE